VKPTRRWTWNSLWWNIGCGRFLVSSTWWSLIIFHLHVQLCNVQLVFLEYPYCLEANNMLFRKRKRRMIYDIVEWVLWLTMSIVSYSGGGVFPVELLKSISSVFYFFLNFVNFLLFRLFMVNKSFFFYYFAHVALIIRLLYLVLPTWVV